MRRLRARRSVVHPPAPRKAFRVSCAWGMPQRGWSWLLVTTPRGGFICRIPLPRGQPGEVSPDVLRGTASPGHSWLPSCLCARNQPRFRAGGSGCPRCRWDWRPEMPKSRCRAVRVWLPPPPGQWREVQLSASCAPTVFQALCCWHLGLQRQGHGNDLPEPGAFYGKEDNRESAKCFVKRSPQRARKIPHLMLGIR